MTAMLSSFLLSFTLLWPFGETKRVCVIYGLSCDDGGGWGGYGGGALAPPPSPMPQSNPPWQESPTPTPLHFIHFVRPLRSAGKASKSSLYCTRRAQRLGPLSHFLDVPLDSGSGFVGIDTNISIKQLLGTKEQSTQLFLVNSGDSRMMGDNGN